LGELKQLVFSQEAAARIDRIGNARASENYPAPDELVLRAPIQSLAISAT